MLSNQISTIIPGDNLAILRAELKSQNKYVKNLKKKSLWSRILEEVMEKLVDIVHFLHLEIHEAFGAAGISGAPQDNNIMLWNAVIFGQQGE
ncbi:protein PSK SIMULATOR 1-like isoform X2 [Gossypium raimondii]|uniref:protein PSK SIMULATOR 1-like isoform X2 n=1 Tax=Gossypium raimondii TaxID=29730 RepID=UPI00227A8DE9|nr:protein PSK SIMULATOR 1-like isoform X2 [Gossypium raimondii]